jgi:hypothetical protein
MILYVARGAFHNPKRDQAQLAGVATIAADAYRLRTPLRLGGREFVTACRLAVQYALPERDGVPVKPLVQELSFVRRPEVWGQYFRSGLVEVSADDFDVMANAVARAARGR